jgi:hypothetical protein
MRSAVYAHGVAKPAGSTIDEFGDSAVALRWVMSLAMHTMIVAAQCDPTASIHRSASLAAQLRREGDSRSK